MATFTFRIPDSMTGRLNSAEMRAWLTQFLRNPHPLPPDPGSGYERISLTLPRELVRDVAGYLRCPPSTALRRVAAVYLGVQRDPTTAPVNPPTIPVAASAPRPTQANRTPVPEGYWRKAGHDTPDPTPPIGEMVVSLFVQALIWVLIVGALLFFTARKNKAPETA
jgi:hypothetical protein